MTQTRIGIDAGGTLVKVAYHDKEKIKYQTFSSHKMGDVVSWLYNCFDNPKICVTGGKSQVLANDLDSHVKSIVEFDATCRGVEFLAKHHNLSLGSDFILANIGTGTSIHYIKDGEQQRIGGTGVGGGTLLGLSYLLTKKRSFNEIVQDMMEGNRESVDLKVKDIFEGTVPPISGDLTASNFGKMNGYIQEEPSIPDILASINGLIGETVVTICCQAAHRFNTQSVVYIGSTFRSNPLLKRIIEDYTQLRERKPFFLEDGEFSGAVGALLSLD
ncbi:type II pantothenate kinase [Pseudalkalibacillus sp. A8]|uniref:type II pantothenate kinase n=1 Tax=Pseudalkalibacillus sp. A8 TaxID=3382641 RepID=UPI0038B4F394